MPKNEPKIPTQFDEQTIIRLGRSLRRFSRTSRDLMRTLGIEEEDVKIPRKKRKPAPAKVARGKRVEDASADK